MKGMSSISVKGDQDEVIKQMPSQHHMDTKVIEDGFLLPKK
jgi:hypothetical protein